MQPISAAIGAGAGLLGGILQNRSNKAASARQMEFQERMSNTAYQRAMADMRAAGLNPLLAYSMGGATTPGGSSYQAGNIGQAAVQGYQAGAQADQSTASADQSREQSQKIKEEVETIKQDRTFKKVVHDERWPRLAATMGQDNVIAAAIMTMKGLSPEEILQAPGISRVINDHKVREMIESFQEYKSLVSREYAGVRGTGEKVVTRAIDGAKSLTRDAINAIEFYMNAAEGLLKK